ncbi:MAG: hypothetical protein M3Z08_06765 [Chloroflexota bacterium]|nr:hypothetical protein [Chloroflexota bacterium]
MSISRREQTLPSPNFSLSLKEFWRLPSLTVARFTLRSYIRSGWIIGDIACVWLLYAAFFLEFGGNVAYFYSTAGQGLAAIAILGTIVMGQRALNARVYLPLARLTSRGSYIRGLMLATGVLRIPLFLLLLLLAMLYHGHTARLCTPVCIEGATLGSMLPGALGLLANCIVISTLVIAFSAPIASRFARIMLLAWIAAILYSNTSLGPVAAMLGVTRLPLIPLATSYALGTAAVLDWPALLALLTEVAYVSGLALLAQYWMARRDLLLQ